MTGKLLKGKKAQDRSSKQEDTHVIYHEAVWEARGMPLSNGHAPFKTCLRLPCGQRVHTIHSELFSCSQDILCAVQENLELSVVPSSHATTGPNYESVLCVEFSTLLMPLFHTKALALTMSYVSCFGLPPALVSLCELFGGRPNRTLLLCRYHCGFKDVIIGKW